MADPAVARRLSAQAGLISTGCLWCKIGCYALAVVLTALAAAGTTLLTEGAAPVVALTAFLGAASSTAAIALLSGVLAAIAASVDICVSYICEWANACPASSTASA